MLECIAQATQRELRLVPVPPDAFRAGLLNAGVPKEETDLILYLFTTVLDGPTKTPSMAYAAHCIASRRRSWNMQGGLRQAACGTRDAIEARHRFTVNCADGTVSLLRANP
ncbi:hypothetical protein BPUN_4287 [Candidatus Paraburkholderia kirkii]|nr:hypothetical protein BPUN_4287 [Candidatus Paraburkholderia kirkii]